MADSASSDPSSQPTVASSSPSLTGQAGQGYPSAHLDANLEQMFLLIDSILPFEACLYYQVIPLSIEAKRLHLGMVDPEDTAAIDYVRRQVSYIQYSLVSQPITSQWHRDMLSNYLNYTAKRSQQSPTALTAAPPSSPVHPSPPANLDPQERPTYVVASPVDLPEFAPPATVKPDSAAPDPNQSPPEPLSLDLASASPLPLPQLARLPIPDLVRELLRLVLADGIGRLYFERHRQGGRILWSKDGVVQAVLDDLPLPSFQQVLDEFKRLTHLTPNGPRLNNQAEIERVYRGQRILIRLRVVRGAYGEEGTIQVLRGAALQFHQQQQLDQLSRDVLSSAEELSKRILELKQRGRRTLSNHTSTNRAEILTALTHLLKTMEDQISAMLTDAEVDGKD